MRCCGGAGVEWCDAVVVQVLNGALLQQSFVVEFTVHNQMCDDCHRVEAKDYWRSCVQVRQKVCAVLHVSTALLVALFLFQCEYSKTSL